LSVRVSVTDSGVVGNSGRVVFDSAAVARWQGPYLDRSVASGAVIMTGFGVPLRDRFVLFDAVAGVPVDGTGYASDAGNLFLALEIGTPGTRLTASQFEAVNDAVDGPAEPNGPGQGTSWSTGRLRFDNSFVAADTIAYYLVMALDP